MGRPEGGAKANLSCDVGYQLTPDTPIIICDGATGLWSSGAATPTCDSDTFLLSISFSTPRHFCHSVKPCDTALLPGSTSPSTAHHGDIVTLACPANQVSMPVYKFCWFGIVLVHSTGHKLRYCLEEQRIQAWVAGTDIGIPAILCLPRISPAPVLFSFIFPCKFDSQRREI